MTGVEEAPTQRPIPKSLESLIDVHNAELSVLRQLEKWLESRVQIDNQYAEALTKNAEFLRNILPNVQPINDTDVTAGHKSKKPKTSKTNPPDWRDLPALKLCDILATYTDTMSQSVRDNSQELRRAAHAKLTSLIEEKLRFENVCETKRSVMRFELHKAREEVAKQREIYARVVEKTAESRARYEALVVKQRAHKLREAKEHYFRNMAQLHMQHNRYCVALKTASLYATDYSDALQPNLITYGEECLESLMLTAKCVAERIASGFERRAAQLVTSATQLRSQLGAFLSHSPYSAAPIDEPNEYVNYLTRKCTRLSNIDALPALKFDATLLKALGSTPGLNADELSVNELIRDRFARAHRGVLDRIVNTEKDIDLRQRDRVAYERECAALAARVHRSSAEFASSPDEQVWQAHFDEKVELFAKQRKLMNTNHELATLHVRLRRDRLVVGAFETCSAQLNGGVGIFPPSLAPFAGELNEQVIRIELADLDDYDEEDELLGGLRRRLTGLRSRFRRQGTMASVKRPPAPAPAATATMPPISAATTAPMQPPPPPPPPPPPAVPTKTYTPLSAISSKSAPYAPTSISAGEASETDDDDDSQRNPYVKPSAKKVVEVMEIDEDSALIRRSKQEQLPYSGSVRSHTSAIHHAPPPLPPGAQPAQSSAKSNVYAESVKSNESASRNGVRANSTLSKDQLAALDDEEWFHGVLPREEVQRLLVADGDYLLRESRNKQTGESQLVLSVQWRGHKHFIVQGGPGEWKFEGLSYATVRDLIESHHRSGTFVTAKSGAILRHAILRASWQIKNDDVVLETRIGQGNFGEVYKGRFKGREVAVKKYKESLDGDARSKFLQEGTILRNYDHPNIVKLIGIAAQRNPIMIVMEYVEGGALLNYLKANRSKVPSFRQVRMCVDAAAGMTYLESKNCIHRDLAARNCLIGRDLTVKIADFGMSREEEVYEVSDGLKQIPIKWTAPEALNLAKYTSKCDVWSFGILMWEIFAGGATPYSNLSNQAARERIEQGYRMPAPEGTPDAAYAIMRRCWLINPNERPTFRAVLTELRGLEKQVAPPGVATSVSVSDLLALQAQAGLNSSFSLAQNGDDIQLNDDEI